VTVTRQLASMVMTDTADGTYGSPCPPPRPWGKPAVSFNLRDRIRSGKFGAAGNFSWSGYDFRRCANRRRAQGALRRHPTFTVIVYARDHDERIT